MHLKTSINLIIALFITYTTISNAMTSSERIQELKHQIKLIHHELKQLEKSDKNSRVKQLLRSAKKAQIEEFQNTIHILQQEPISEQKIEEEKEEAEVTPELLSENDKKEVNEAIQAFNKIVVMIQDWLNKTHATSAQVPVAQKIIKNFKKIEILWNNLSKKPNVTQADLDTFTAKLNVFSGNLPQMLVDSLVSVADLLLDQSKSLVSLKKEEISNVALNLENLTTMFIAKLNNQSLNSQLEKILQEQNQSKKIEQLRKLLQKAKVLISQSAS